MILNSPAGGYQQLLMPSQLIVVSSVHKTQQKRLLILYNPFGARSISTLRTGAPRSDPETNKKERPRDPSSSLQMEVRTTWRSDICISSPCLYIYIYIHIFICVYIYTHRHVCESPKRLNPRLLHPLHSVL